MKPARIASLVADNRRMVGKLVVVVAMTPEEQRKSNLRLGLILASIAVVIFVGFIVKSALFGM